MAATTGITSTITDEAVAALKARVGETRKRTYEAWELDDATLGTLDTQTGNKVKYTTSTNTGVNVLRAEDGEGNTATAVITQN